MHPEFHMQSIRPHPELSSVLAKRLLLVLAMKMTVFCWRTGLDQMTPKALRIKAYNLFRGLIPRNRIRISFRDFFQQSAHSVPSGPVRLNTNAEKVGALPARGLGVKARFVFDRPACQNPALALLARSSRPQQVFDVLETQGR